MNKTTSNLLRTFIWVALLNLSYGQLLKAQQLSKTVYDSAKNLIQNTKDNENWLKFAAQLRKSKLNHKENVNIVHIGDSHIQGGYFTNRMRELLYKNYGVKERGFIFPYSLLKANGPEDVRFYSSNPWEGQKYNHSLRKEKTGISGYHLLMTDSVLSLTIALKQGSETMFPFSEILIYHDNPRLAVSSNNLISSATDTIGHKLCATTMVFNRKLDSIQLQFCKGKAGTQVYGIELRNSRRGISYHSIGVNGASFETFIRTIDYLSILKALQPDCIMISLGTNDCYLGRLDTLQLKRNVRSMIESIRHEFPKVCILFTTPGDYLLHKKYLNPNLIEASLLIKATATALNCEYWDFFEVMGGLGASKKWAKNGLMYKDILHLSKEGYKLQGDLFFSALCKTIETIENQ